MAPIPEMMLMKPRRRPAGFLFGWRRTAAGPVSGSLKITTAAGKSDVGAAFYLRVRPGGRLTRTRARLKYLKRRWRSPALIRRGFDLQALNGAHTWPTSWGRQRHDPSQTATAAGAGPQNPVRDRMAQQTV